MSAPPLDRYADDFERLSRLPEHEREAALADLPIGAQDRAVLRSLLDADRDDDDPLGRALAAGAAQLAGLRDDRIGPYRVLRELGTGGMGTVYLAERVDGGFAQQVAIKRIRAGCGGSDVLRRFRRERQILAGLVHPNIARLLDGGETADGVPYLVMEYVDGVAIDRHCDAHGLGVRARLALFREVCAAVQFAHQRLVVHGDLKPGNILIDGDGRVKLLDFGIARLLEGEREAGEAATAQAFTPEYASPEQVKGAPVTTASDVYSLGVLLYRLLAGRSPYRADTTRYADLVHEIVSTEPERPSASVGAPATTASATAPGRAPDRRRLRRDLRGDLDNIVMMALRKDPERRYASVEQLADDIEHHLERRPVRARGDAFGYRARRFLARNRLGVGLGAVAVTALLASAVYALHQAHVAREQAARAQTHFASVRALANQFMGGIYEQIAYVPGTEVAQKALLDTSLDYLGKLAAEAGQDRGLLVEIATSYIKLARMQERTVAPGAERAATVQLALDAVARAEAIGGRDVATRQRRMSALALLASAEIVQQKFSEAHARFEEAVALAREDVRDDEPVALTHTRAQALRAYAEAHDVGTTPQQRVAMLREASTHYADVRARVGPGDVGDEADNSYSVNLHSLAQALNGMAPVAATDAEALAALAESLRILEALLVRRPDDLRPLSNLIVGHTLAAIIEARRGQFAAARADFGKARGYDARMLELDPGQQRTNLNRISVRLFAVEAEARAGSPARAQLAELDAIEVLLRALPADRAQQPEGIALGAWLDGLRAEFLLRHSAEAGVPARERRALVQAAVAGFDDALARLANVPGTVEAASIARLEDAAGRARAALAAP